MEILWHYMHTYSHDYERAEYSLVTMKEIHYDRNNVGQTAAIQSC